MSSTMSQVAPLLAPLLEPKRIDLAHTLPDAHYTARQTAPSTAIVRQRFYPAQWKRFASADLATIQSNRNQRLNWTGWDRSLPCLYLPIEPLTRLLLESVDGIMRAVAENKRSPSYINLRIESRGMGGSQIVVALEAPEWQCDAKFRGALNARWFRSSSQAHLWQRLARQSDLVGGWLGVADLPGGGATLLINLPTDRPRALVTSWLTKQMVSGSATRLAHAADAERFQMSLYAIGRNQRESAGQLQAANVRLQSLAGQQDFIYRTGLARWIWLTLGAELPSFVRTQAWQSQRLDRWDCGQSSAAIVQLSSQIAQRFEQLIGSSVPPIDLRTHQISRAAITSRRPHTRVDNPAIVAPGNHLQPTHAKAKWRYPI